MIKIVYCYQLLIGPAVVDIELGREDYGLIPHNYDRRGLEPFNPQKLDISRDRIL
jgi:hypothetical protein